MSLYQGNKSDKIGFVEGNLKGTPLRIIGRLQNLPQPAAVGRYLLSVRLQPFADISDD